MKAKRKRRQENHIATILQIGLLVWGVVLFVLGDTMIGAVGLLIMLFTTVFIADPSDRDTCNECYNLLTMAKVDDQLSERIRELDVSIENGTAYLSDSIHQLSLEIRKATKKERRVSKRRETLGQGLIGLGNLSLGGLYFGQAFGGFSFDTQLALLGVVYCAILYIFAYKLLEEK